MVIESANLSSLASSSAAVESVTPPLLDGAGISEGFSDALVAQIELLSAMKTEDSAPVQIPEPSRFTRCRRSAKRCRFACK